MPDLNCQVTSCRFNTDDKCEKMGIQVEGCNSTCCENTCCASFKERDGLDAKDSTRVAELMTRVECNAVHCRYNEDYLCYAANVDIGGNGATRPSETECNTFEARK